MLLNHASLSKIGTIRFVVAYVRLILKSYQKLEEVRCLVIDSLIFTGGEKKKLMLIIGI